MPISLQAAPCLRYCNYALQGTGGGRKRHKCVSYCLSLQAGRAQHPFLAALRAVRRKEFKQEVPQPRILPDQSMWGLCLCNQVAPKTKRHCVDFMEVQCDDFMVVVYGGMNRISQKKTWMDDMIVKCLYLNCLLPGLKLITKIKILQSHEVKSMNSEYVPESMKADRGRI